ncbi:MAG TPA: hypothetical protein VGK48_16875 [Terriglobia bacterium]|jgi:hypothetical protein
MHRLCAILAFTITLSLAEIWTIAADDTDSIKLVTTGRVEKIDTKHKTFQFKFTMDAGDGARRPVQNAPYPGRGGGRRGRGGGFPGRTPFPNAASDNSKEVKVFVSDATRVKGLSNPLQFSDLKSGDHVTITAIHRPHSDELDAQVIVRN